MNPKRTIGVGVSGLAAIMLILAPPALARTSAKFKVLSLSGTTAVNRQVVYEPSAYGEYCSYTQTEQVSFHTTKPITAYAFTSKSHGNARVEWSPKPEFLGNLGELSVPGEMTVSRSATYQQSVVTDPDTGETSYGCYDEGSPDGRPATDCEVERTFPVTIWFGGTSDLERTTFAYPEISPRDSENLDQACWVAYPQAEEDPRVFSRAALFNKSLKRVKDTQRVEEPTFDDASDDRTTTGTIVDTLTGDLKRKRIRRR